MDDILLVSRARAGDLDAFGQLYDAYFNRIYDFAWRILRDADEAADVTQDVFMKAMQNLPGLTKAASFKSWLFSIAHNTAITRAERAGRTVPLPRPQHEEAFGAFDVPDPSRLDNPELAAGDAELASLVWEAASALNPRDYALLDLHVRQGLESAEIAGVMNVSKGNAYTMVSRMKSAAADVISSYVVARRGSQDCETLRDTLAAFEFPPYTEEVRRAVDDHITACDTCQRARRHLVAPLEIFGAFAMVPAPLALKGDVWGDLSTAWYVTGPGAIGGGKPPAGEDLLPSLYAGVAQPPPAVLAGASASPVAFGSGGADLPPASPVMAPADEGGWDRTKIMWFIGGVIGLLLFAFAGGALIAGAFGGDDDNNGGGAGDLTRTATPGSPTPPVTRSPGVIVQTPTIDPNPSDTPVPTDTSVPTETPTLLPTETPTIAVSATNTPVATPTSRFQLTPSPTPGDSAPTPTPCSSAVCPTPTDTPLPFEGG
jgi:RNA polymerase sigma factor (sigma-70 family)